MMKPTTHNLELKLKVKPLNLKVKPQKPQKRMHSLPAIPNTNEEQKKNLGQSQHLFLLEMLRSMKVHPAMHFLYTTSSGLSEIFLLEYFVVNNFSHRS